MRDTADSDRKSRRRGERVSVAARMVRRAADTHDQIARELLAIELTVIISPRISHLRFYTRSTRCIFLSSSIFTRIGSSPTSRWSGYSRRTYFKIHHQHSPTMGTPLSGTCVHASNHYSISSHRLVNMSIACARSTRGELTTYNAHGLTLCYHPDH